MTLGEKPGPGKALASLARYVLHHKLHSTSGNMDTVQDATSKATEIGESDARALQLATWLRDQRRYDNAYALTYKHAPSEDQQLILSILQQLPEPSRLSMLKSGAQTSAGPSVTSDLTEQAEEQFVAHSSADNSVTSTLQRKKSYDNLNRAQMYFWSVDGHGECAEVLSESKVSPSIPVALDLALSKVQAAEYDVIDIDLRIAVLTHASSCNGSCGNTSCQQRDSFVEIDTLAEVLAAREADEVHPAIQDFRKSMANERKAYRQRVVDGAFAPSPLLLHSADAQQWPCKASYPPGSRNGEWRAAHRHSCDLETLDSLLAEWSHAFDRVVARREAVENLLLILMDEDSLAAPGHLRDMFDSHSAGASPSKQLRLSHIRNIGDSSFETLGMFKRESISRSSTSSSVSASSASTADIFHMSPEPEAASSFPTDGLSFDDTHQSEPTGTPMGSTVHLEGRVSKPVSSQVCASLDNDEGAVELMDQLIEEHSAGGCDEASTFGDMPKPLHISKQRPPRLCLHVSFQDPKNEQETSTPGSMSSHNSSVPTVKPRAGLRIPIDSPSDSPTCCAHAKTSPPQTRARRTSGMEEAHRPPSPYPQPKSWLEGLRLAPWNLPSANKSHGHFSITSNFTVATGSSDIPSLPSLSVTSTDNLQSGNTSTSTLPGLTEMDLEIARMRRRHSIRWDS